MIEIIHNKIGKPKFYAVYKNGCELFTGYGSTTIEAVANSLEKAAMCVTDNRVAKIDLDRSTLFSYVESVDNDK